MTFLGGLDESGVRRIVRVASHSLLLGASVALTTSIVAAQPGERRGGDSRYAATEEPEEEDDDLEQRVFSFGPTAGFYHGFGGGIRVGNPIGLEAFGGWLPLLLSIQRPGETPEFDFRLTRQVGVDAYFIALTPTSRSAVGVLAGYKYNDLLSHGGTVAAFARLDLNHSLAVHLAGGPVYFPDGEEKLLAEDDIPDDAEFGFPGPSLQFGINVGLLLYL